MSNCAGKFILKSAITKHYKMGLTEIITPKIVLEMKQFDFTMSKTNFTMFKTMQMEWQTM